MKVGDTVQHQLHGIGTVVDIYADKKLVAVFIDVRMGYVHVHPVSLTVVPRVP